MALSPFPIDKSLTSIVIAYKNGKYIADDVAPRVPVDKQAFIYSRFSDDTFYNIPDTRVGRRSQPNEISLEGTEDTSSTEDYGLDNPVPQADVDNADDRFNPIDLAAEHLAECIALDRELRTANLFFNAANYAAGLKTVLSGSSMFSDPSSSPITVMSDALDLPLMRPNQMIIGQGAWTKLRRHPEIVEAALGTGAKKGMATRQQLAEILEIDEVIVGEARANQSKPGQTAALYRLWGNHIALTYKHPTPTAPQALTFAKTFQWGPPIAGQWPDKNVGIVGGTRVRVGERVKELIIASQAGYFIQNAA